MRRIDRQRLEKRADKLFSRYIKKRDGVCQRCSSDYGLDCAHIISRSNKRLRYDPQNAIALDRKCHSWWHLNPSESTAWFREKFPDRWKYIASVRQQIEKPDYEAIINGLNRLLKDG